MKYKIPFVNFGQQYKDIRKPLLLKLNSVLSSGRLVLQTDLEEFEKELAEFVGTEYAVGLNSGTDALFLSLKALGVGVGHEVITVSHTFKATIEAINRTGATPILVEIGEDGLMNT